MQRAILGTAHGRGNQNISLFVTTQQCRRKDLDSVSAGLRRYDQQERFAPICHSGESRNPVLKNGHAPYVLNSYRYFFISSGFF
ncbi:hypothetical protein [Desulfonatronum parangueonense]